MPWDLIIFYMIGAVCVLCAGGVVAAANPLHSAIFLVLCFFNVAGIFLMLGAEFLAVVQVIVYTGAILVLLLFVLMLVDPDDLPEFHTARPVQRTVGTILGGILLLEIGVAIIDRTVRGAEGNATPANVEAVGGNVQALGRTLYSTYVFPFEVASLVLTVGVIGAIVLAMPERLGARIAQRRGTISLGHARGVDYALPAGPEGETVIPGSKESEEREAATAGYGRDLIMVRDPDQYTAVGRRGSRG
ncbi:MAG: NADH-quinone oxidoreductase subunit J [Thermomicrobiales bacterium]|nr:NADH-quinone oxidoreductase subunit J [Thermomicrobiales bacterium]